MTPVLIRVFPRNVAGVLADRLEPEGQPFTATFIREAFASLADAKPAVPA